MERNVLFIVEGERDEPIFIRKLFSTCFKKQGYNTYTYRTNIHVLARYLSEYYPDFDRDNIEINSVLCDQEKDPEKRKILKKTYTDIFLIFDFDPQDSNTNVCIINRMLDYFDDSVNHGKLFINYPMMQSYRHFKQFPDDDFYKVKVFECDYKKYKQIVGNESGYTNINKYDYDTFFNFAVHHLKKANYILTDRYEVPKEELYEKDIKLSDIFMIQVNNSKEGWIYVLNTCVFILIDYNHRAFYNYLHKCD